MPYHKKRKQTLGMSSEQHAGSGVFTIGPGTVATAFMEVRNAQVGARDPAGGNDTIQLGRSFDDECNIGDLCKYMNLTIQCGARSIADKGNGWLEWGFCCHKESDSLPTNTNLGTQTLMTTLTRYFRNECIFTGAVPVGKAQTAVQEIKLKIPKTKHVMHVGDVWRLYMHFRTTISTETGTDNCRVITSFIYRNYH